MLDRSVKAVRIRHVDAEDRALLRSNPSAAIDAGMRTQASSGSSSLSRAKQGGHPGRKALNLGVWGSAPGLPQLTGVPFGNIEGVRGRHTIELQAGRAD